MNIIFKNAEGFYVQKKKGRNKNAFIKASQIWICASSQYEVTETKFILLPGRKTTRNWAKIIKNKIFADTGH